MSYRNRLDPEGPVLQESVPSAGRARTRGAAMSHGRSRPASHLAARDYVSEEGGSASTGTMRQRPLRTGMFLINML